MTTTTEDIFALHHQGYICVIPVNCFGVAGAGLAKAWRERDPAAHDGYVEALVHFTRLATESSPPHPRL